MIIKEFLKGIWPQSKKYRLLEFKSEKGVLWTGASATNFLKQQAPLAPCTLILFIRIQLTQVRRSACQGPSGSPRRCVWNQLSLLCQQQPGEFRSGPTGVSRSLLGLCLFNKNEGTTAGLFSQIRDPTLQEDPRDHDNLLAKPILLCSVVTIHWIAVSCTGTCVPHRGIGEGCESKGFWDYLTPSGNQPVAEDPSQQAVQHQEPEPRGRSCGLHAGDRG